MIIFTVRQFPPDPRTAPASPTACRAHRPTTPDLRNVIANTRSEAKGAPMLGAPILLLLKPLVGWLL